MLAETVGHNVLIFHYVTRCAKSRVSPLRYFYRENYVNSVILCCLEQNTAFLVVTAHDSQVKLIGVEKTAT